ncbi:ABC transporter permease [Actinomadura atramentaria]|uniref:ABC transporter permease n=1 Tax=Actinomadura atramentaria TaxID=1990 RepID=UPI00037407D8|nr:ABC transporter permease [Actinomadura atramentaria]
MSETIVLTKDVPAAAAAPDDAAAPRRRLGPVFWVAAGWLALIVLAAALADLLPLSRPGDLGDAMPGAGPSAGHLLGTDDLGRDLLSRVIYGARVSLIVGFASIAVGLAVGGVLGLLAGYFRGWVDAVITAAANVLLAFPALVLGLAVVTFLGPSLPHVTLAISLLAIGPLTLMVRGATLMFSEREFVLASRLVGARTHRTVLREVLPNVVPSALSLGLVSVANAMVAEGGLSFLGLSVRPPDPTWGNMIAEGSAVLERTPAVALWPAVAMFLTVLSLNYVGDRLRGRFDVKEGAL